MRYYLDTQGPLKFFKTGDLKELIDLEYLRRKASKIYLNIDMRLCNYNGDEFIKADLIIPGESNISVFLTPIIYNLIHIEDYNNALLDGRFNDKSYHASHLSVIKDDSN